MHAPDEIRTTSSAGGSPPLEPRSSGPQDAEVFMAAAKGAMLGFAVIAGLVALGFLLAGVPLGGAIGVGAFIGFWGGTGFGFMMGGSAAMARHDGAAAHAEPSRSREPVDMRAREAA